MHSILKQQQNISSSTSTCRMFQALYSKLLYTFTVIIRPITTETNWLFMVALWNRADHYIFILSFVLLLLLFFPRLI